MAVIQSIIDQHAEEAAFCWLLREAAIHAPNYDLAELAELDERVDAHLDGLQIAGDEGWRVCCEQLSYEEPGEVFTAAMLALPGAIEDRWNTVIEAGLAQPETTPGLISALGWMNYSHAAPHISRLLNCDDPQRQLVGLAASAIHRQNPGTFLAAALNHEDIPLRTRALFAIGELGALEFTPQLTMNLGHTDAGPRFAAAWAGALSGNASALIALKNLALGGHEDAARLAARALSPEEAQSLCKTLAQNPNMGRVAMAAIGALGDPVFLQLTLERMKVPDQARAAGEAFSMITGIDLEYEDLDGDEPENFEAGPTDDPEDENVEMDQDEDLPWPNQAAVANWLQSNASAFTAGERYLAGKLLSEDLTASKVLRIGTQRQRAAAAIELKLADKSQPLFEIRAPGRRQRLLL